MPSVSIDPGVLAAPSAAATAEEVHGYVDTLIDWRRLLRMPAIPIHMTDRAAGLLHESGLFPLRPHLASLFGRYGVEEYDANTIARVVDTLLQQTPTFEDHFRMRDVLADDLATEPPLDTLAPNAVMASDLGRCVVLLSILGRYCRARVHHHSLVVRAQTPGGMIRVRAKIQILEHERDDLDCPTAPYEHEGTVISCHDFRTLVEQVDEAAVWRSAVDAVGFSVAAQLSVFKSRLERRIDPEWDAVRSFQFGAEFFDRSSHICSSAPANLVPKVLRAVASTLEDLKMADTHALREGSGANDSQRLRKRDGAKGWRRDVDYEYHLHYWQCPAGAIEFGWIGPHNDFRLPE